jgi:hypothetical protein
VGGLIGKSFGPAILQAYLTTDVYEKNYGVTTPVCGGALSSRQSARLLDSF